MRTKRVKKKKNYHEFCIPHWEYVEAPKPACFTRLEILARPNKNLLMNTFMQYRDRFPQCRVEKMKIMLQELCAMTPEDAEKYFAEMRSKADAAALKRKIQNMLKMACSKQKRKQKEEKAYRKARKIITKGLMFAALNETPPIHSIRLRHLSNIILEQLCDLLDIPQPERSAKDKYSLLLISLSDWMAIAIEKIYFPIRMANTKMLNQIDWRHREITLNEPIDFGEPLAASSGIDMGDDEPKDIHLNLDNFE
ncbi:unnamed protein product [Brassicogethes aeneus]|uniref:Uncharacterized protein n=1 Tax=Brassicogethes aeneus TaxID=1431903 RepID=A0A9P0FM68_BRAAE|nr:unnamed protein product [Brassicogethes aeneus]